MESLREDAHSPGPKKREVRTLKLRTLDSHGGLELTRSAEMRGPPFHDPLVRCSLALPSFLLLRNDHVGLVAIINYNIFSPLLSDN